MRIEKQKMDKLLANIRLCYIVFYMAYISIVSVIPVRLVFDGNPLNAVIYPALALSGGLLLLIDLLYHKTLLKTKNCGLLVLFVISLGVSIGLNMQYGIADNVKTFAWTCIQLFLFAAIDTDQSPKLHFRHLQIFTELFGAIWFFWASWSMALFLQQYHRTLQFADIVNVTEMGFCQGRLFGIFTDPNYAALVCLAAIAFSVLNLNLRKCSLVSKVYHYIQIVVQACYIVLSGSRTAQLCITAIAAFVSALMVWRFLEGKKKRAFFRTVGALMAAGISVVSVFLIHDVSQTALSFAPSVYEKLVPSQSNSMHENELEYPDGVIRPNDWFEDENGDIVQVDMTRPDVAESDDISNNRFKIWKDYVKVYATAPLFGTSPRNALQYTMDHFDDLYIIEKQYSVHNTYLALLVCTGAVGACLMLGWMILRAWDVIGYLIRRRNTQDQYYRPVLILTCILIADAIAALPLYFIFFNNMIIDLIFWVTMGYVTGFIRMSEPERYKEPLTYRLAEKVLKRAGRPQK